MNSKEYEIQNSKQNCVINHLNSITSELVNTVQNVNTLHTTACDVLQKWFESDPPPVHSDTMRKLKELHQKTHEIFCLNQDIKKDSDNDDDMNDMMGIDTNIHVLINGKRLNTSTDDDLPSCSSYSLVRNNKRFKIAHQSEFALNTMDDEDADDDTDSDDGDRFKMPNSFNSKRKLLNETQVLSSSAATASTAGNSLTDMTFNLGLSSISNSTVKKTNLISNILSDNIVRAPNNKDRVKEGNFY